MKKTVFTEDAPAAIGPYSQGVVYGNMVYTSGQIGLIPKSMEFPEGDISEQTLQALKNLESVLKASGSSLENVIKVTCFIGNMDDFSAFNNVYSHYFGNLRPARSCVEVSALPRGALIELEAIACVKALEE